MDMVRGLEPETSHESLSQATAASTSVMYQPRVLERGNMVRGLEPGTERKCLSKGRSASA